MAHTLRIGCSELGKLKARSFHIAIHGVEKKDEARSTKFHFQMNI